MITDSNYYFYYCQPAEIAIPYALFQLIIGELLNKTNEKKIAKKLFVIFRFI